MKLEYTSFSLPNGLKVIVHEDTSLPKVVINLLYRVGSKDELAHRTGFAHLFEHLMFEGSKHIQHFDKHLHIAGGESNAFTNVDITNYYLSVPSNQLPTAFWLESDRMLELDFSEEKLNIQKGVVIEEYKQRYLNQPYGDAHLKLRALHYQKHPYQWPTIGKDISHIEEATLDDVKDFFYGFYAPNNAVLVIAGDVGIDEAASLAESWFGEIPSRVLKKHAIPQEPPQTEKREMTVYGKVPFQAVYKMYHMPPLSDRGYYIMDLVSDLLASGKSSLFYQNMIKGRMVSPDANSFVWGMHDPGVFSIEGKVAEGKSIEDFENGLEETLKKLDLISEAELQRVKNKVSASLVMDKLTLINRAMGLAMSDTLGDTELINQTVNIYRSISLSEIKTYAAQLLTDTNSSTLYYLPDVA